MQHKESPKLRECPFCGGDAFKLKVDDHGFVFFSVVCHECHARTNGCTTEARSVEAWNRRSADA